MNADPHPSLHAAKLAGADDVFIGATLGVPVTEIVRWREGKPVPKRYQRELAAFAMARVMGELDRVGRAVVEQPKLVSGEPFRDYLNDLNLAHWLVFGQSWLKYLNEREVGRDERR